MSLFGALFTSVSGMSAQSQATAMISNNIANVDTIGFKSDNAAFYSLVTTSTQGGEYNPGTVTVNTVQNVNLQGAIQQTSSSTDAAISGNGFFVVKQVANADQPYLYTRSGSFTEDSTGQLVNSAGDVLYGWPLGNNGALPSNSGDLASLQPVNVAFLGGLTKPTTTADLSLNLNASEVNNNPSLLATATTLPLGSAVPANFTRALTVYDSLGSPQNLTIQMRKIVGPMANTTTTNGNLTLTDDLVSSTFPGITAGAKFTMKVTSATSGVSTQQYIIGAPGSAGPPSVIEVDTVGDLVNQINTAFGSTGNEGKVATASLDSNGHLLIQADDPAATMSFTEDTGAGTSLTGSTTLGLVSQPGSLENSSVGGLLTTTHLDTVGTIHDGNQFSVSDGTKTFTYDIGTANGTTPGTSTHSPLTDVASMLSAINADFAGKLTATLSGGNITITPTDPAKLTIADTGVTGGGTPTGAAGGGLAMKAGLTFTAEAPVAPDVTTPPSTSPNAYASTDPYAKQGDFPTIQNTVDPNTAGWWEATILKPDGTTESQGLINFNGDGTLNASPDSNGVTGINLQNISWGNGSDPSNIDIDISKFTQFAGQYNVVSTDQNGAALGLRTGVEIAQDGTIVAQFSNGATANLYKLPLATFSDPDGLLSQSGTAYSETAQSGTVNLREAGTGGAGLLQSSSLEGSNVDLADEFAKLIVSQRAYTADTRVVNTIDDMTQDLLRLV